MMKERNLDAKLVLLDEDHSGRDEMNLAGNPFALLQAASKNGQTFMRREWPRTLANGKTVTASWNVNGDAVLGLPGPQDELLYLVLLQISREQKDVEGQWPVTVHFSRRNVLERMGWQDGAKEYRTLKECFARLQAVSIRAEWSFFDARVGGPVETTGFNLIDAYQLHEEKTRRKVSSTELPFSWFKWSEVLYNSLSAGNVRSLALDFTLSLDMPISRRLFRLLELLRHARKPALDEVSMEVFSVRDRLGMANYSYPSKVKEKLQPAVDELISRGYLASVEYEKVKRAETALFRFGSVSLAHSPIQTIEAPRMPAKTPRTGSVESKEPESDIRADALRCHAVFIALPEAERNELLELAKADVSPIWHDRVGQVDSPMSLGLWLLVTARYPERLK
jgi:hypothetical protein